MKKNLFIAIVILLVVLAVGWWVWQQQSNSIAVITTFEECTAAGNAILESYPPQCRAADGRSFTQDVGNELEKADLILLNYPRPGQTVTNPLIVTGQARGTWFFEASFPVHLQDKAGATLATAVAQAEGEWMTEKFVPFRATLNIPAGVTGPLTLVLEKDNPSGLLEHDDQLRVPVTIATPQN